MVGYSCKLNGGRQSYTEKKKGDLLDYSITRSLGPTSSNLLLTQSVCQSAYEIKVSLAILCTQKYFLCITGLPACPPVCDQQFVT